FEGDMQAVRSIDEHFLKIAQAPFRFRQAHDDAEVLLTFPDLGRRFAGQPNFNHIFNITNVQAIAGGAVAVDFNERLRHFSGAVDSGCLHAANITNRPKHLRRFGTEFRRVVAENLDDDLAVNLGDALQNVVADGLGETGFNAWKGVEVMVHFLDDLFFGQT